MTPVKRTVLIVLAAAGVFVGYQTIAVKGGTDPAREGSGVTGEVEQH